jgi:DNA-directed RNA polymerase sigma subunit (sigma70/sigma32)
VNDQEKRETPNLVPVGCLDLVPLAPANPLLLRGITDLAKLGSVAKREHDHDKETYLAKKIEMARKRFCRKVLECDYALAVIAETLQRVHSGEPPCDDGENVSLPEKLEQDDLLRRTHILRTLELLIEQDLDDFEKCMEPRYSDDERRRLRRSLRIRRRKAATLIEELSIGIQKLQPLMCKLEQISARMDELEKQIQELKGQPSAREDRANLEKELADLQKLTLEDPMTLRKRVEIMKKRFAEYEVVSIAKEFREWGLSFDDLLREGSTGLTWAIKSYEPVGYAGFSAHATRCIRQAITDTSRNTFLATKIEEMLDTLPFREREIIKLRYGVGDGYTYTLEEVGRIFRLSGDNVQEIEAKALEELRALEL